MTNSTQPQPDQIGLGILLIVVSVVAMSFGDAMIKRFSLDLTLWQIFVMRSVFALTCLAVVAKLFGSQVGIMLNKWVILRSSLLVMSWIAFYASLPVLPLSVVAVAAYTNPIFTALISAFVTGEKVSGRQWIGVMLGFSGVAAILRPGTESFSWYVLLPILAAILYSASMILTRTKMKKVSALTLAMGLHVTFIVCGGVFTFGLLILALDPTSREVYPFLLENWGHMSLETWYIFGLLGLLSAAFFMGVARAYQIAPPQIIGTFDYAYLVAAAVWGFGFFADMPDRVTVLGMVLITLAGVLVALSPRQPTVIHKR